MKNILLILILVTLAFFSCNQNPQNPLPPSPGTGTISYTINDTTNISWNTQDYFSKGSVSCALGGLYSTAPNIIGRSFAVSLYTDNFTTSLYVDTNSVACNKKQLIFIINENEKSYTNKFWIANTAGKKASDTWLKITSLTTSTISGTFGGRMIGPSVDYTDTLNISNGVFTDINFLQN